MRLLGPGLTVRMSLRADLVDVDLDVVEVPAPLLAHDVDRHVGLLGGVEQRGLVAAV
jgi:hypothetical protein